MNDKVMTKPSEVVRDFFQELVVGLPTGNMGRLWREHDRGGTSRCRNKPAHSPPASSLSPILSALNAETDFLMVP
jgi:hypothetical protein